MVLDQDTTTRSYRTSNVLDAVSRANIHSVEPWNQFSTRLPPEACARPVKSRSRRTAAIDTTLPLSSQPIYVTNMLRNPQLNPFVSLSTDPATVSTDQERGREKVYAGGAARVRKRCAEALHEVRGRTTRGPEILTSRRHAA